MKKFTEKLLNVFVLLFAFLLVNNALIAQEIPCRTLVWSDEFNYTGEPDPNIWYHEIMRAGAVNNELQAYVNNRANSRVENGVLVIEATKERRGYNSARLFSNTEGHRALHGRIEVRAQLPSGIGTWPAIWMMPENWMASEYGGGGWPNTGEIDIMEHVGFDEGNIHASTHSLKYYWRQGNQKTGHTMVPTACTEFHVYALEWTPAKMDFYVDDVLFFTTYNDGTGWEAWPFTQPFAVLLNIAIGGDWGGPVDDTIFDRPEGVKMLVDYVRVYDVKNHVTGDYIVPGNTTANYTASAGASSYNWSVPQGAAILSGQGTNSISVAMGNEAGTVSVDMETPCGTETDNLEIIVAKAPQIGEDYLIDDFSSNDLSDYTPPTGENNFALTVENGSLRIDYDVTRPDYYPNIGKKFNEVVDLTYHTKLSVRVRANNEKPDVNFRLDLRDFHGYTTNEIPFEPVISLDGNFYTYTWDFDGKWLSSYPQEGMTVDPTMIISMEIFVNYGGATAGAGTIWVDDIVLSTSGTTEPPVDAVSVHVQSISTGKQGAGKGKSYGTATVTINNDLESPVEGATVTGTFSGSFSETVTGTTGADGNVTFVTTASAKRPTVDFCIDDVIYVLPYDNAMNDITCTDGTKSAFSSQSVFEKSERISIYPNPTTSTITVEVGDEFYLGTLLDLSGKVLMNVDFRESKTLDVGRFQKGVYIFKIIGNDQVEMFKIIKK